MGDSDSSQILSLADLIREIRQDQREDSKTLQKILIDLGKMQAEQEAQRQRIEAITAELQQVDSLSKVQDSFDLRLMTLEKAEEKRGLAAADLKRRGLDILFGRVLPTVAYALLGWLMYNKPPLG